MTKYPELPDELHELEQSIYDCKNVIYDIKKSEKYADNLDEALDAISTLYKVKFAELISRFNDMERKYIGLHESWHDMKPTLSEEESNRRMDIIGQNITKDLPDGATAGAIIGGILGNQNSTIDGKQMRCKSMTRYNESMQTIYSHSTITFVYEGKQYKLNFKK